MNICRAEVVGSMLRPAYLRDARPKWEAGELSTSEFKAIEDRAVDEVIALQENCGVDVVTDGEMRRFTFTGPLTDAIEGIEAVPGISWRWYGETPDQDFDFQNRSSITGKLKLRRSLAIEEFVYARARATRPLKVTLPSPLVLTNWWNPDVSPQVYRDPFEMYADATAIVRREAEDLAALGCTYIQIDAPELATLVDERQWGFYESIGAPPERLLREGVELLNSIPGVPGVTFALHLCRGNNQGRWMSAGGYERISQAVFAGAAHYDIFSLEYDDERSGGFEPLTDVPDDKIVVLGLVSSKKGALEDPTELTNRVAEAGAYYPREQLALSTQCGFGSIMHGNDLSEAAQADKLRLVSRVAHDLWP